MKDSKLNKPLSDNESFSIKMRDALYLGRVINQNETILYRKIRWYAGKRKKHIIFLIAEILIFWKIILTSSREGDLGHTLNKLFLSCSLTHGV